MQIDNKFDCIVSRVFAPLCKIIEWCHDFIADNGLFIAMKANLDADELNDVPCNAKILENIELHVPSLDAKRQAMILKLQKT
ncbi:MAG: hypothetical protein GX278_03855 [Aeromonadales bacterium]|nr:hypothetical protein [Aeromonadales bacterium]